MASLEVILWRIPNQPRSEAVCNAMFEGIRRVGDRPRFLSSETYKQPEGDVAAFYGLLPPLDRALRDYSTSGRNALYIDLGYWKRVEGVRLNGYHKISINDRHPTAYFQHRKHKDDRLKSMGVIMEPWRTKRDRASPIIIAGMSKKGATAEGFALNDWEAKAARELRAVTERPIWYRPKPNDFQWKPLGGGTIASPGQTAASQFRVAHAIVAHHSNLAVEAITAGVPGFVTAGVATAMGNTDLAQIENPVRPDDDARYQWLADIAWTQWSVDEMRSGRPWRYLRDEGLI